MLRKVVVFLAMACMCYGNAYAENNYPYKNVYPNPSGGRYRSDLGDGDPLSFWKCECVSYTAYKVDDEFNITTDSNLRFNNFYRQPTKPAWISWSSNEAIGYNMESWLQLGRCGSQSRD